MKTDVSMIIGSCLAELLLDTLKYKNTKKYRLLKQYSVGLVAKWVYSTDVGRVA